MPEKSRKAKVVRRASAETQPASESDLDRLRRAMDETIDTSEIPENHSGFHRLQRDDRVNLPKRRSLIREAIKQELESRKMTPYRLWKEAVNYCPTISQSAVYDFIKGERQLELPYAEALMAAVNLGVARLKPDEGKRPRRV